LNAHQVGDVQHIEIHTSEPLVPGYTSSEVGISIADHQVLIKFWENYLSSEVGISIADHQVLIKFWENVFKQDAKITCRKPQTH
jgi:hypothetical protein